MIGVKVYFSVQLSSRLAVLLVDRLGRRPLVIVGLATATISLFLCYLGFEQATYSLTAESINQMASHQGLANLVQQFFPWQLIHMGAANIFLFYSVCGLIGFVIMLKIMPETKNKSIEEIEEQLDSTPSPAPIRV